LNTILLLTVSFAALVANDRLMESGERLREITDAGDVEIVLSKPQVYIPCYCHTGPRRGYRSPDKVDEATRVYVSVTTNGAVPSPPTYRYEVSGGKVSGDGPVVLWDLSETKPGLYMIVATVSRVDGSADIALTKSIEVANEDCHCGCNCPFVSVRSDTASVSRGDTLKFSVSVFGGDALALDGPDINWAVSNGHIVSGQGWDVITVKAAGDRSAREVTATAELSGFFCACLDRASASVPIGRTVRHADAETGVTSIRLDENHLVGPGRNGYLGCGERPSPDMIAELTVEAFRFNENARYQYSVSEGKIIGSGKRVKWDLTGAAPGTYFVEAWESLNGKMIGEKRRATMTTSEPLYNCDPSCPTVSLLGPTQMVSPGESFSVAANVSGGSQEYVVFNWTVSAGQIISGQGSPTVKVRTPSTGDGKPITVTLNLGGIDPRWTCVTKQTARVMTSPKGSF
jgi:hypothetical protein